MPLNAGERLGPYEIVAPIGAGGMGEVYRAKDSKLGREVAIKVLPEEFTQHPQKLARFEREARLLAALNHPGIATIHEVEEHEGKPFLVMELVEGETLADRIASGRRLRQGSGEPGLPVTEALEIAQQIAEALDAAHEKGVIHRDLKPANIKVDPEGQVKVLDFGLAKAFTEESAETDTSFSPTLSRDATRAGVILGTAAYMSPEQAKGKTVDKRTDIFSFGIVLFEMLTGKRAFAGDDVSDVLAAILRLEPNWKALPGDLDSRIHNLLHRCLTKDRKNRLRDMGDARFEIQEIITKPSAGTEQKTVSAPKRARVHLAWGLAVLLAAFVGGITIWSVMRSAPQAIMRFPVPLSVGDNFTNAGRHLVALSPDGTRLVYVANEQLYLREMAQIEAAPIRGTDMTPTTPFFSPDGRWVGFYAGGNLRKVAITGGAPVTLCEAGNPFGASWGDDDNILFGQGAEGILRVSANGGIPEVVIPMDPDKIETAHGPQMLPDGRTVLFTLGSGGIWDEAQIVAQSLETGERQVLIEGGSDARYVPTGHLVYALGETLTAVPFDLESLEVTGGPVPVVEGVARSDGAPTGAAHASFSDTGSLVYVSGGVNNRRVAWVDRDGRITPLTEELGAYLRPRLSPDGRQVAVENGPDIWIQDIERDTMSRLTTEGNNYAPVWSPDGQWIAFRSDWNGDPGIYRKRADFSGPAEVVLAKEFVQDPKSWSPDGTMLVYAESRPQTGLDVWVLPLEGEGEPRPLLQSSFREFDTDISPDGRWMAYESNESGRNEVYVQAFPDGGRRWPISTEGGNDPMWSPAGRELFYRNGREMLVAEVETEPEFHVGTPRLLFEGPQQPGNSYDVAPDGQRLVMIEPELESGAAQLNVVLNWFEELKRLVPTD